MDEVKLAGVPAILCKGTDYDLSKLEVEDTQLALGGLGAINRALFPGFVAAITGSSGKTTVKNLVTSVFAKKAPTIGSKGNLNNEIGVPLTLLNIGPSHEFAVIEMGAGKPGDIKYLCELVKPNAALALNALPAHLQGMGNLSAVAEEPKSASQLGLLSSPRCAEAVARPEATTAAVNSRSPAMCIGSGGVRRERESAEEAAAAAPPQQRRAARGTS